VYDEKMSELHDWICDELELEHDVAQGIRGMTVQRVQEWLNIHNFGIAIDGDFGPVTDLQVRRFQSHADIAATGVVDGETFGALVRPMTQALRQRLNRSATVGAAVIEYAYAHLAAHPREVGGTNRGPWVRLYMRGLDGPDLAWCAGFTTFVLAQAAESIEAAMPIAGSFSCDVLAAQGGDTGRFVADDSVPMADLTPGSIFLVRRTSTDWTHTGIVTQAYDDAFDTIEGNTNDAGARDGIEVCARSRGYASKDFIIVD
jgi:hypothetical protein